MTGGSDVAADDHARRAARTYGAAADHYAEPGLGFWDRFGADTVTRLGLRPGGTVLDLCCGAGASAIPAAQAVGTGGRVLAVDVAAPLLALGAARAARLRLTQVEFRLGDARDTGLPDGSFDAVVCVFGVFFVPDMAGFVAEMWRLVRPGGTLAVTTWGPGLFEPANGVFWDAVRVVEPALHKAFNPWDEIVRPAALRALLDDAGVRDGRIVAVPGSHQIDRPDQFWEVVLGSGYRATVDALTGQQQQTLRDRVLRALREADVTTLRTDVLFGTAVRPSVPAS